MSAAAPLREASGAAPRRRPWPALEWARGYQRGWLWPDVAAGLTTASVVIPKAMAYASIAGLPVQHGLYSAFAPTLVYALLGTSGPLSVSTSTTIAILLGAQLDHSAPGGDAQARARASAMAALLVGAFLVAAALLRCGFLATFLSEPILVGFKAGIGVVIVVDQAPKLLGIEGGSGNTLRKLVRLLQGAPGLSWATLAVAAATISALVLLRRFCRRAPAPLVAVAFGICLSAALGLEAHGVACVPEVPRGLPAVTVPQWSLAEELWPGCLAIALMSFTETVAAGRAFAGEEDPPLEANRELLATGLANVAGSFLGALAAGGGTTQTAVSRVSGARTQLAGLVVAAASLLAMLWLAPLLGLMPEATLAAVVVVYSAGLVQPAEFRAILEVRCMEFTWAVAAFAGVLLLGTLKGILVAVVLTLVSFAGQVANAPFHVLGRKPGTSLFRPLSDASPEDETFPGLLLVRLEGRICFANADNLADAINPLVRSTRARVFVLDLSGVFDLEYTALKMMARGVRRHGDRGVELWLAGLSPSVRRVVLRAPLGEALGEGRIFESLDQAVDRFLASAAAAAGAP